MSRTDPSQVRALKGRCAELPGEALLSLPVAFVASLLADLEEARAACAALDTYKARIELLVSGGEEYV